MSTTVSPFALEDLDIIASLHVAAFESTKYHQTIFGGCRIEDVKEHSKRAFAFSLNDMSGQRIGLKATNSEGKIVGYALMEERGEGGVEIFKQAPLEGMNSGWAASLSSQEVTIPEHHLRLRILAVDPVYQGKGVGTALMNDCIEYADSKRWELYLNSTSDALSFYLSHSFLPIGVASNDPDESIPTPIAHLLVRLPQPLAPLTISLAVPSDASRSAQIHRHSFGPHSLHKTIYGGCETSVLDLTFEKRFKGVISNPANAMYKVTRGKFILGFAYWELPVFPSSSPESTPAIASPRFHAPDTNLALALPWFELLDAHAATIIGPHYHLIILATEPSFQKNGVAKKLIEWAFEKADKEGVNVCLDATKEGEPVYEKLGFVRTGHPPIVLNEGTAVTPMVRSPITIK